MVALSANRFVCEAIAWINSTTPLISSLDAPSDVITSFAWMAVTTAVWATSAAWVVLREISAMLEIISSLAAETEVALAVVSSALATRAELALAS